MRHLAVLVFCVILSGCSFNSNNFQDDDEEVFLKLTDNYESELAKLEKQTTSLNTTVKANILYKIVKLKKMIGYNCLFEDLQPEKHKEFTNFSESQKTRIIHCSKFVKQNISDYEYCSLTESYIYKNKEYLRIINEFPGTLLSKKCEFENLVFRACGEWEGFSEGPIKQKQKIETFIKKYPELENEYFVVRRLAYLYSYLFDCTDLSANQIKSLETEAKYFYLKHRQALKLDPIGTYTHTRLAKRFEK